MHVQRVAFEEILFVYRRCILFVCETAVHECIHPMSEWHNLLHVCQGMQILDVQTTHPTKNPTKHIHVLPCQFYSMHAAFGLLVLFRAFYIMPCLGKTS